jgi:uncharacterized RDD family membrane protein YckC
VTNPGPPAGWYLDPDGSGGLRYFDGTGWTPYQAAFPTWHPGAGVPSGYGPWGVPPWKGSLLGRPRTGPGSLANPARRLGARLLDGIVLVPFAGALIALAVALVAPHAGPMFPALPTRAGAVMPTPGFVWVYLAVLGAVLVSGVLIALYEAVATARYGRTLGKAWLHIRPVGIEGGAPGWGRSFGRVALFALSWLFNPIGLLDPLWCLWDPNAQCLHDKVAGTIVVND